VREIGIDGGDGCVSPSDETISDGSYPLSRSLYIYVNNENVAQSEALQGYVDYYLTDEALNELVSEVGYIPLPTERIEATRGVWAEAA
jgi:phosphate transport system substrate-binding protein